MVQNPDALLLPIKFHLPLIQFRFDSLLLFIVSASSCWFSRGVRESRQIITGGISPNVIKIPINRTLSTARFSQIPQASTSAFSPIVFSLPTLSLYRMSPTPRCFFFWHHFHFSGISSFDIHSFVDFWGFLSSIITRTTFLFYSPTLSLPKIRVCRRVLDRVAE